MYFLDGLEERNLRAFDNEEHSALFFLMFSLRNLF